MRLAVVGAGVAGSAAALLLARSGHDVTLFEAVAQPQPVGAGVLLQPTGLQVLQALGLHAAAQALGAPVEHLYGDTPQGRVVLDMHYARLGAGVQGLGMQRGALMGLLWQALRGSGVAWQGGVTVDGWQQGDSGVQPHSAGRGLGRFDALVLASGMFSPLRERLGLRQRAPLYPWGALWCVLPLPAGGLPGVGGQQLRQRYRAARQMIGLMPVGRPHPAAGQAEAPAGVTLFWSQHADALAQWQARPDLPALRAQMLALLPQAEPLLAGLQQPEQLRVARYADVVLPHWHQQRVVALGDCAHGMSPQLGQGANMALLDAAVLAHTLVGASATGVAPALQAYSHQRRAHLRYYQAASRWLTPLFQSHHRLGPWLRDHGLGLAARLPWVQAQAMATLCGSKTGWLLGRPPPVPPAPPFQGAPE